MTVRRLAAIVLLFVACLAAIPFAASADGPTLSPCDATYTVTSTDDSGTGSLREAFSWVCAGGVIDFDLTYPATITLTTGELTRVSDVTLAGPGPDLLAISGDEANRVISSTAPITITGVTIRDGHASGDGGGLFGGDRVVLTDTCFISNSASLEGGAIYADGWLTANDCRFVENSAMVGGAIAIYNHSLLGTGLEIDISDTYYLGRYVIVDSVFERNTAVLASGAIDAPDLIITNTQFLTNTAILADAGAVYATYAAWVADSRFQGNQAETDGGGLYVEGALIMTNTQFVDNSAIEGDAGGVLLTGLYILEPTPRELGLSVDEDSRWAPRERRPMLDATIGLERATLSAPVLPTTVIPISVGVSYIDGATFDDNSAEGVGGGLCSDPGVVLGLVRSTFDGNVTGGAGGGAAIASDAIISDTEFLRNRTVYTYSVGGGLLLGAAPTILNGAPDLQKTLDVGTSEVHNCLFEDNTTDEFGGGLYIDGYLFPYLPDSANIKGEELIIEFTPTLISGSRFISNTAAYAGAGLVSDFAVLIMVDSSVIGNVTEGELDQGVLWGTGGGVQLMDMPFASLTNVTIADNQALGDGDDGGGGLMVYGYGPITSVVHLNHVTIVGNETTSTANWGVGGGGISQYGDCQVVMTNTLVAENESAADVPDIDGPALSGGGNLIGSTDGCTCTLAIGDVYGDNANPIDPLTGPLGFYGGSTETAPLLPGSVAINGGTVLGGVTHDQRGVARDGMPDTGAFESQGFTYAASGTPQSTAILSQFADPLVATISSAFGEPVDGGQVVLSAPSLGATAALVPAGTLTIANGQVSTTATANGQVGSYVVIADIPEGIPTLAIKKNILEFELTNLPVTGEGQLSVGPAAICPGYNLYYDMVVTNTSPLAIMHGLRVTATLPAGTEFYGDMEPADGAYDPGSGQIVWDVPPLSAGEVATMSWAAHTFTSAVDGSVYTGTASWSSQVLAGETYSATSVVDTTICEPPPPEPLTVFGVVYAGDLAAPAPSRADLLDQYAGIPGATVTATTCVAGTWVATTDANGAYEITIPGASAEQCSNVTLDVYAEGYGEDTGTWSVAELRQDGERDFVLDPWQYSWLPLLFR